MGYWIKTFRDGNTIVGEDKVVNSGLISWSKTSLDNICEVSLVEEIDGKKYSITIKGYGEFWQSDTFEIGIGQKGPSKRVKRRIAKKVLSTDDCIWVKNIGNGLENVYSFVPILGASVNKIPFSFQGKWLIAEIDLKTKLANYYIRENRL